MALGNEVRQGKKNHLNGEKFSKCLSPKHYGTDYEESVFGCDTGFKTNTHKFGRVTGKEHTWI